MFSRPFQLHPPLQRFLPLITRIHNVWHRHCLHRFLLAKLVDVCLVHNVVTRPIDWIILNGTFKQCMKCCPNRSNAAINSSRAKPIFAPMSMLNIVVGIIVIHADEHSVGKPCYDGTNRFIRVKKRSFVTYVPTRPAIKEISIDTLEFTAIKRMSSKHPTNEYSDDETDTRTHGFTHSYWSVLNE